jgi:hypothetical protein
MFKKMFHKITKSGVDISFASMLLHYHHGRLFMYKYEKCYKLALKAHATPFCYHGGKARKNKTLFSRVLEKFK